MAGEESRWVYLGIFCFHAKVQDVPLQGSLEFWRQILQLNQSLDLPTHERYCYIFNFTYDFIPIVKAIF